MEPQILDITFERLRAALSTNRTEDAVSVLLDLHPADQAEVFSLLSDEEQSYLLSIIDINATADLLEELEDEEALEAVEALSTERLADVLDEMEPDEAADLIGDLPPEQASVVLAQMEDPSDVIPLLGYPDESAGGLMTTSYIALRRHTKVDQAIQFLRQVTPDTEFPYYLYVIDREKRLAGVVSLRGLVVSGPEILMEEIMDPDVIYVNVTDDQEEAARVMSRYDLAAVPVVDEQMHLLGVITHDDIIDVLEEEATEDIYRLATVIDTDLEPESPIRDHLRGRLPWMYLNMCTAMFASWVVTRFEEVIAQVALLAAFQSVVAGLGGNSGSQNVVMIVRSLALGRITANKIWGVMRRQIAIGFLQGLAIGLVVGAGVALWQKDFYLGLIILLAMIANMMIAGIVGTLVPFLLTALGKDPALASTILVTATTDAFGFFIFLSLASFFLPLFAR
jgi:magnesium transporter